ncbi:MAG: 2-amino-4-hydroxy-6-hydroxymethyldihydropteridine diphosphokinase, partial [FCB group bacterium]|nr:2-amino-4-hydroxy-6-hydroxymethyldihydropteridine diphosphokinase [FCB group bacterium]
VDILFAGNSIIKDSELVLPHPLLHQRKFVLVPMAEITTDFVHPVFNKSITELLNACEDDGAVDFYATWDTH